MYISLIIIAIISAIFMIMAVLLQKSKKEGGLDPLASSTTQIMGITKTTNLLEKFTWGLAFTIAFCCMASTFYLKRNFGKKSQQFISPNVKVAKEKALLNTQKQVPKLDNKKHKTKNKK
ncbi:MAG: preprotein translocase subunit SecG [Bacteroidetes bacterium]|nr:preprotein translocase subunit SecG [Bacteroidota bacterium]